MAKIEQHVWYKQYLKLKADHPDSILLYRLGDFYEVFDDDAKLVAELLEVTLTRKDYATDLSVKGGKKLYCPMAGMPYHAVEGYVARLVSQGYRVAIAEQMSETASSKSDTRPRSVFATGLEQTGRQRGIVHREVIRVITPGTIIDPSMLPSGKNNYLAAVIAEGEHIGLSYVDLSTGEFAATELSGERAVNQIEGELARLQVSEVLVPDDEKLRLPNLSPVHASLTQDLAPMTKQERDMLLPHERVARRLKQESQARWTQGHITVSPVWCWDISSARDILLQQLGVQSLTSFGLDQRPLAMRAAGAILHYISETQRRSATQISTIRVYTTGTFMFLDPQTRRNLELLEGSGGKSKGALIGVLDRSRTPMGARLIRRWLSQPLLEIEALQHRQDCVACCVENGMLRAELRQALGEIGDMERVVNRIVQGTGIATPRDLVHLRQALRVLPKIIAVVGNNTMLLKKDHSDIGGNRQFTSNRQPPTIQELRLKLQESKQQFQTKGKQQRAKALEGPTPRVFGDDLFGEEEWNDGEALFPTPSPEDGVEGLPNASDAATLDLPFKGQGSEGTSMGDLDPCSEALALLERALDDDPPALLGASNYLQDEESGNKPRRVIRPGYDERIDQVVAASLDAQNYINGLEARERDRTGIKSLKVAYNKVFGYYIEVSRSYSHQAPKHYERKQTLVNAERYITAELKEYESVILNAQQRLVEYEREAFMMICRELATSGNKLLNAAQTLARIDVFASLAEAAVRGRYIRPTLNTSTNLHIVGGRHPVVEQVLDEAFVPNHTQVDTDRQQILLITGPNMAGKSTVLRQVALIVLMAQVGSFVPAEKATIGLVDRIFTRIGAQDDIATGQSTFMVEMSETAALLMQSSPKSLIILDEVGRGTSTYDGIAIARAVVEYIHNEPRLRCRTLFATHYHELTDLEDLLPRVKNYHMAALEQSGKVVFLYELRRGFADRSYGIHVAELAGIPRSVIRRATELLAELESRGKTPVIQSEVPKEPQEPSEQPIPSQPEPQRSLLDIAPNPVVEYLKRLNVHELTPIEAMMKLYELQKLAQTPVE